MTPTQIKRALLARADELGISDHEIARRLGMTQPAVWRRWRADMRLSTLIATANALGMTVEVKVKDQ